MDPAVAAVEDEREAGRQKPIGPCGKEGIRVKGTAGVRQETVRALRGWR